MRASDRAYDALRTDIIDWRLPPGTVLGEVEQSARLGISRTPLREALARLTSEGLTAPHSGRGVVVTDISLEMMSALFDARLALDCRAAELAAVRRSPAAFLALAQRFDDAGRFMTGGDPDRHGYYALVGDLDDAIDDAAANPYLLQAQRQLRIHLVRVRRLARDNPARLTASAAEHAQIARFIADGNAELSSAATKVHLYNSLQHLLAARHSAEPEKPRKEPAHG